MSEHELPEPRTATVYDVWGVYKDYDANAPDTHTIVWCATEALADEVCAILPVVEGGKADDVWDDVCLPCADGFEHCSSYRTRKGIREDPAGVARSLADVRSVLAL